MVSLIRLIALALINQFRFSPAVVAMKLADEPSSAITADSTAIRKVITLLEEMKVQVQKEASQDEGSYEKYECWCRTNEEAKTEAIDTADKRIGELTSFIEEMSANAARLKIEISGLAQDVAEDQDAVASATALRQKEEAAFLAEEEDLKETLALLREAVGVLAKVQLLQKMGKPSETEEVHAESVLIQFRDKIQRTVPKFQSVLQKDLFDALGAMEAFPHFSNGNSKFLPRKSAALMEQKGGLLPWEKHDEQKGMEAKPNDLVGAAAQAKSYNSRSGRVLGLLREMGDETARDLADAQKADFTATVSFQKLRAAKLSEIATATKQKKKKEADLADTLDKSAKAKRDKARTTEAMEADQDFLSNMIKDCKIEEEEFKARVTVRSQELVALAETLRILTADDARDLYAKTLSFMQLGKSGTNASLAAMQERATERAMQRLAAAAKKHRSWALASLAVRVRLDAFTKVKEAMDTMLAELAKQQKEEYAKWELCKSDIDRTEDDIKVGKQTKEDLDEKHRMIVKTIETLTKEITALKSEEENMKISLKEAGENRKAENQVFQVSITDQRATTNILHKALDRLKRFYSTGLVQVQSQQTEPGRAVEAPPPKPADYSKAGNAGGVIQLIMKIIENSEVAEKQFEMDEQRSQSMYADFVKLISENIEAHRASMSQKSIQVAEFQSRKSETEEAQLANDEVLAKLAELLKAHHLNCDYLLQYFDVRQQARAEEMDAITDAKAVLSGASFGK